MKRNVGTIDKAVRILIAVVAAVLYFAGIVTGIPGIIFLVVGGILLITGLVGTCPIYLLLRQSTNKKE